MSTNPNATSDVFAAFIEADKALKELPAVRADLEAAHSLIDEVNGKLSAKSSEADRLATELSTLRADLANREAALADATFRRDEATKALEHIQSVVTGLFPKPEPVRAVDVDNPVVSVTAEASQGQSGSDPTQSAPQTNSNASSEDAQTQTNTVNGQSVLSEDQHNGPFASSTASDTSHSASPADLTANASHDQTHNPEATHNTSSDPTPTAHSPETTGNSGTPTETPAATPIGNSGHTGDDANHEANAKPFAGREYWAKPSGMSWSDWTSGGGIAPSWLDREPNRDHA